MVAQSESLAVGEYNAHQREILLETVAKGCSPEQFAHMLYVARDLGVDPFKGEICVTPQGWVILKRDGLLKIAHRTGNFDGMETTFDEKDGEIRSATCTVWNKQMSHPIKFTARMSEFSRRTTNGKGSWDKMPAVMLQKCAESHALRRAFAITGVYDEAELPLSGPSPEVTYTATIDGEPAEVTRLPGKCSRCGRDPMIAMFRDRYDEAFKAAGKVLPPGICEECAKELWRA